MELLAASQAARSLGVSSVQIGRLIKAGELDAQRFGRSWVVDADSLRRYQLLRPGRGRPLSEKAAWQRIVEASTPSDMDEAVVLAGVVRRRSANHHIRILPAFAERLDADNRIMHGGSHAAVHHGAAVGRPDKRDIYIHADDVSEFRSDYRIGPGTNDVNAVLRVVANREVCAGKFSSPLVVVLDLVDAADSRAAVEALRSL